MKNFLLCRNSQKCIKIWSVAFICLHSKESFWQFQSNLQKCQEKAYFSDRRIIFWSEQMIMDSIKTLKFRQFNKYSISNMINDLALLYSKWYTNAEFILFKLLIILHKYASSYSQAFYFQGTFKKNEFCRFQCVLKSHT